MNEKDKLVKDLEENTKKLENALDILKKDLDLIQKGNGNEPYWNGSAACGGLRLLLQQLDYDTTLLENVKECCVEVGK